MLPTKSQSFRIVRTLIMLHNKNIHVCRGTCKNRLFSNTLCRHKCESCFDACFITSVATICMAFKRHANGRAHKELDDLKRA